MASESASSVGLVQDLLDLLSSEARLDGAVRALKQCSMISDDVDQHYTVNEDAVARLRNVLDPGKAQFWRQQALVIAYRAITWKYIDVA